MAKNSVPGRSQPGFAALTESYRGVGGGARKMAAESNPLVGYLLAAPPPLRVGTKGRRSRAIASFAESRGGGARVGRPPADPAVACAFRPRCVVVSAGRRPAPPCST